MDQLVSSGSASSRRRRGKRKTVREAEGDVADCEEEVDEKVEEEPEERRRLKFCN